MKKLFTLLLIACACQLVKAQVEIPHQEISYNVNYHWGIIDVNIARGTVTIQTDGDLFTGTLDGSSIPWEGKIICVSDTLKANMTDAAGNLSESVVYQNGWYRHIPVSLYKSSNYNPDDPAYFKSIAGQGSYDASSDSMEAITVTSDMLGMYYFAHALDFSTMEAGHEYFIPIDGKYSKKVLINYQGQGVYNVDGNSYRTYDLTFEYSYDGSMSGFPVECKIGVDNRIPLFISASLPVGRVEMLYSSN